MRLLASILVIAIASPACTFVGLGIGLETPETENVDSRGIVLVEPGTEMELEIETAVGKTSTIRGRFASVSTDVVVLEIPEGRFTVNRRWLRRVTVNTGTQWVRGALVGAAVDTGVVLVALFLAGSTSQGRLFR